MAKRSISTLTRRLREAGFEREFVRRAILPDWWDQSCRSEPDLLPEIEIRVGRFLGVPMSVVTDPESMLAAPGYPKARLRCVRDVDRDRLTPAIHAATGIAGAVVRNLNESVPAPAPPPPNGLAWRQELPDLGGSVDLDTILKDLWARGIPVVPTQLLPAPSFQGLAAVVEDRPVVVLGHRHDEPGRAAFRISHEAGHIARGDCMPGAPVVDKDEEIVSDDEMERFADRYAMRVVMGEHTIPELDPGAFDDFRTLANRAVEIEQQTGIDAGAIIFTWARTSGDYATATMATKALYLSTGAGRTLRKYFRMFVDVEGASLSDRELMRVVVPASVTYDAPAG
ncbi:MAG: hypothetical protein OXU64_06590 [Gemmatimonadota bacterium]|nr:hypothetical protein [Gemmatimonadota bacterium]